MITTGDLKMQAQPEQSKKTPAQQIEAMGLQLHTESCPRDGTAMFIRRAPCWLEKAGFKRAAKCLRCGHQIGIR